MSVQAWFSSDEVTLAPGDRLTLPLTVHNLGDSTESFSVVPAGLTASWTTIDGGTVTLFGGSQEVLDVTVTPPPLPTTTAGPTAISIRVIPLGDSDDAVVAEATVVIEAFDDVRIVPLQPILRARHRASYEFMVENHGNTVASCRLHLIDPTDRVDGDFDPPAVGVAPGAASLVRLRARAKRGGFRRSARTLDFEVEAGRQGHPPVSEQLAFIQSPTVPGAALARAAAVVALVGAVVLAWFAVVRPTIEDAVRTEVDEQVAALVPDEDPTSNPGVTTTVAGAPDDDDDEIPATPEFFRLTVAAPLTETADQTTTMRDGSVFDVTDVRVENPANDRGVATLLLNGDQIFIWSLENVRGSYFEPRITPIRLQPGDNVTFSVRCDEIGGATQSTCTNSIFVGGTTTPVTGD